MIRAFLDSSVFISACLSTRGASHEIIRESLRGNVLLVISDVVLEETMRNLSRLPRRATEAQQLFQQFLAAIPFEQSIPTTQEVQAAAQYVVSKDAPIIAAAKNAQIDYLVSLDRRHLVGVEDVSKRSGLKIVLPDELLRQIRLQSD